MATAQEHGDINHPGHGLIVSGTYVDIGTWDAVTRSFESGGFPANAVRVTVRRAEANVILVDLFFAGVIGITQADLCTASPIATPSPC